MKDRYKLTAKTLKEEILFSLSVVENGGNHTNKLGYMLLDFCNKIVNKTKIALTEYELDDIKQEMVVSCLVMINRQGYNMNNPFNYLYSVARMKMFERLREYKKYNNFINELESAVKEEFLIEEE